MNGCKILSLIWREKLRFIDSLSFVQASLAHNPGQKCWDTCTFSLKIAPLRFPPPPSPSQCFISGLKVHFFGATLTRGEGGRHFAQTRPSRASKTERLANTCHIFRLSQGLLSRIAVPEDVWPHSGWRTTIKRCCATVTDCQNRHESAHVIRTGKYNI